MTRRRIGALVAMVAAAWLAGAGGARAAFLADSSGLIVRYLTASGATVVPAAYADAESNISGSIPFGGGATAIPRYEQVADASAFAGLLTITGLAFRAGNIQGAFSRTFPGVSLVMSTTAAGPDTLSADLDANLGPDAAAVFGGTLTLAGAAGNAGSVPPFDAVIQFTTPFSYDPARGNLLFDFRNPAASASLPGLFLASVGPVAGDPVGRAYQTGAVPEPAGLALLGVGLAGLLGAARLGLRRS